MAAECDQHDALDDEQHAEGHKDAVDLLRAAVLAASHEPLEQEPVKQPVQHGRERDGQQQRHERAQPETPIEGDRAKGGRDQRLAIGEVHDACDAVLQRQAECDEGIHAPQHKARQDDVEQQHEAASH